MIYSCRSIGIHNVAKKKKVNKSRASQCPPSPSGMQGVCVRSAETNGTEKMSMSSAECRPGLSEPNNAKRTEKSRGGARPCGHCSFLFYSIPLRAMLQEPFFYLWAPGEVLDSSSPRETRLHYPCCRNAMRESGQPQIAELKATVQSEAGSPSLV